MIRRWYESPFRWLLIACVAFGALSLLMYALAVWVGIPGYTNQLGIWNFVPDANDHRMTTLQYADLLRQGRWGAFWSEISQWHVGTPSKLYAVGYWLLGPHDLSIIPIHMALFALMLTAVFLLTRRIWGTRAAFVAAALVACWPSSLLHMTQPIKDMAFLSGELLFLLALTLLVTRGPLKAREALAMGAAGGAGLILSVCVRPHLLFISVMFWTAGFAVLAVRWLRHQRDHLPRLAIAFAVAVMGWSLTASATGVQQLAPPPPPAAPAPASEADHDAKRPATQQPAEPKLNLDTPPTASRLERLGTMVLKQLAKRRDEWRGIGGNSVTNIDTSHTFNSAGDLLRFLPRAWVVGFLSPSPRFWLAEGRRVGFAGRAVSGLETLAVYCLLPLTWLTLWRSRRRCEVWFLAAFALVGVTFLGLIVTNLGALFRMRYAYWFVLFMLVAPSLVQVWDAWRGNPRPARRLRVLRIITRTNVGGPALHVSLLHAKLDPARYETMLVTGAVDPHEADYLRWHPLDPGRLMLLPQMRRSVSPWDDLRALWALFRLIRRVRPDIVHTHLAKAGALGRAAAWLAGVPVIVHTYHGHVLRGYFPAGKERLFLTIERGLARVTTRLIAVSDSVRRELLELRVGRPAQFRVIPLGLDIERFLTCEALRGQLRHELGVGAGTPLICIVARLAPIKRHLDLMQAARRVVVESPHARFLLVGDGEERQTLERAAREGNLEGHVMFLGWRNDLDRIYADCDVVTLTSANEGLPVSLIEAMAAARPVVATQVGGVPDLVRHQETGLLVKPADCEGLAQALLSLIADPARARALGQQGREHVRQAYRAERLVADMDRLYQELTGDRCIS